MAIEWGDLRVFQSAVRAGGYTTAARRLGINRTTVGRRLGRLEEALGRPLWEQGRDGYRPTATGEAVLKAALAMERAMGRLARELGLDDDAVSGARVRVASTLGMAAFILPHLADRMHERAPAIEVVEMPDAMLAVAQRQADIGIAIARSKPRTLAGKSPGAFRQALYTRAPAGAGPRVGFGHAVMLTHPQSWTSLNAPAGALVEVNSLPLLHDTVGAGFGRAWLWEAVADRDTRLVRLPDVPPRSASADIWVVHRADIALERGSAMIRDEIFAVIAEMIRGGMGRV